MSTIVWLDGEQETFRATLLPDEVKYFVDEAELARCRDRAGELTAAAWKELGAKTGYHVNLLVAYGPRELAVQALAKQLDDSDSIWPFAGALAVLGGAAIPTAIRSLERAVANIGRGVYANQIVLALDNIAPVRSPRVAELVLDVLASAAKPKAKALAKAWLARHGEVAGPAIAAASASRDPKRKAAGKAAAKLLA